MEKAVKRAVKKTKKIVTGKWPTALEKHRQKNKKKKKNAPAESRPCRYGIRTRRRTP